MNNNTIDYAEEDLFEYYKHEIILNWVKENHPKIIKKTEEFLKEQFLNKDK